MGRKKRAKIEDLRKVKQVADELLIQKGIQLPHDQSAISRIFSTADAPILPGLPAYLPHVWTINTTRRVLYDLAREWQFETKHEGAKQENATLFFRHVISGLEQTNSKIRQQMMQSAVREEYDLRLIQRKDAVTGIAKFLVDSFAVFIVTKQEFDVSTYTEWFLRWTDSLLHQWSQKTK